MKKVLIIAGLVILGFVTGGGIAYWKYSSNSVAAQKNEVENTEVSQKELPEAKSIEEYKLEFSKDKKYKENCLGDKPIDYSMFDVNDINAANQAVACYQLKYDKKRGTKEADEDYSNFRIFFADFGQVQHELIYSVDTSIYELMNSGLDEFPQKYYKYGLIIQFDEGDYIIDTSNKYLNENLKDYVSMPEKEILQFNVQFDKRITSDCRYTIPKSELVKHLEFWENFKKKYPEYSKENNIDKTIEYQKKEIENYPNL